jgi:hypothetical protein
MPDYFADATPDISLTYLYKGIYELTGNVKNNAILQYLPRKFFKFIDK